VREVKNASLNEGHNDVPSNQNSLPTGAERRESPRIECEKWVRISYDDPITGRNSLPVLCKDVSESGCRLAVAKEIPVGPMTLYLDKEQGAFEAQAVYCHPQEGGGFVVGCRVMHPISRVPSRHIGRVRQATC